MTSSPPSAPLVLNGVPETMRHGEGAYARCYYCGRYSLDPNTLSDDASQPVCECGKRHGWSGSFVRPGPDAKWSGSAPSAPLIAQPAQEPTDPENQWICDMMVLQVLADSESVNDQEREVLTRWMADAPAPSQRAANHLAGREGMPFERVGMHAIKAYAERLCAPSEPGEALQVLRELLAAQDSVQHFPYPSTIEEERAMFSALADAETRARALAAQGKPK